LQLPAPSTSDILALWHQSNDNDSVSELFVYLMLESPDTSDLVPMDIEDVSGLAVSMTILQSSLPILDLNEVQECTGVLVHWTAGSVWDSYPYMQHSIRSLPWEPIGFDGNNKWLHLHSKHCSIILLADALIGFKTGNLHQFFPHCTQTHIHCNPQQVIPITTCKSHSVL